MVSRRSGTSAASSAAVASPCALSAASVRASTPASRRSSQPGAPSASHLTIPARSLAAIVFAVDEATTGASSALTAKSVRRMHSSRTSDPSSYSARSTSAGSGEVSRAQAARWTVAGSVACSPTTASATSSVRSARYAGASRCRRPRRARRAAVSIRGRE